MSWEGLVAAALLGTGRREPEPDPPPGAPDDLAAALHGREPEDALLAAAAAWAVARRAGVRPGPASPPDAAPQDPRPLCSGAAGRRLAAILDGEHARLLPEWLAVAAGRGLRPPPELLPDLLSEAERRPEVRVAAHEAAGPRGPWLTARRPEWASPAAGAERVWAEGARAARRDLFTVLRGADPAGARALLESTWAEESPDDREAFVSAFAVNLGPGDDPFLEAALDDARKPVRKAAALVLRGLPSSALAARMAERTRPLLTVRRKRLDVDLPTGCDAAMEHDGIERRAPRGTGERQFWLSQMLAATPLATWPEHLGAPPDKLVRMKGEWVDLVREAWAIAALRQRDEPWARALYAAGVNTQLLRVLPQAEREAAAAGGTLEDAFACPGPWGVELSRAVLQTHAHDLLRAERDEIALRLHPDTLDEATELCDLAGFRAGMLRELR